MGNCLSSENAEEVENKKRSRAIDAKLEEDSQRLKKECKILLLGALRGDILRMQKLNRYQALAKAESRPLLSR